MIKNACGDKVIWWWLRSPGSNTNNAANVNNNGNVNRNGNNVNNNNRACVPDLPRQQSLGQKLLLSKSSPCAGAKEPYSLSQGIKPCGKRTAAGSGNICRMVIFPINEERGSFRRHQKRTE